MESSLIEQKLHEHTEKLAAIKEDQSMVKVRVDTLKYTYERDNALLDNKVTKIGERADEANEKTDALREEVRDLTYNIKTLTESVNELKNSIKEINQRKENNVKSIFDTLVRVGEAIVIGFLMVKFGFN